jgi:hypothetical protein
MSAWLAWLAWLAAEMGAHAATFKKYPPKKIGLWTGTAPRGEAVRT